MCCSPSPWVSVCVCHWYVFKMWAFVNTYCSEIAKHAESPKRNNNTHTRYKSLCVWLNSFELWKSHFHIHSASFFPSSDKSPSLFSSNNQWSKLNAREKMDGCDGTGWLCEMFFIVSSKAFQPMRHLFGARLIFQKATPYLYYFRFLSHENKKNGVFHLLWSMWSSRSWGRGRL